MIDSLKTEFSRLFKSDPTDFFFAPGRVNLIGEHIDYNGGLVMPCAITPGTYLLTAANNEGTFRFRSMNFKEKAEILLRESYEKAHELNWINYPLGVIDRFARAGKKLHGMDFLFFGDLPIGASLSSSASIEVVTAFALNELFKSGFSKLDLVKLAMKVENDFMGLNSGIMDQFAIAFGAEKKALKLDCNTLEYEEVPVDLGDHVLAIINTNKSRKLTESKYNERVNECLAALKALQKELDIPNLCAIDTATFKAHQHLVENELIRNRAQHVIEENDRVKLAFQALSANDLKQFGELMYASHNSLRNLYEVSGTELDTIVDYCLTNQDVTGARMTGAGFCGCAIALVKESAFDKFSAGVEKYYTKHIGYAPSVYRSVIGDGVKRIFL